MLPIPKAWPTQNFRPQCDMTLPHTLASAAQLPPAQDLWPQFSPSFWYCFYLECQRLFHWASYYIRTPPLCFDGPAHVIPH